MPREKAAAFEDLYARLEESVAKLEQGGLSLEEAIALYEQGMTLARQCQERLDVAEQKISKLKESFANIPSNASADGTEMDGEYASIPEEADVDDEPFG